MTHQINPLTDPRWMEFLERQPAASVFHSRSWLEALFRTYGYEPVAITTSAPGQKLRNALLACRVHTWLTGRRLVSLPFSDHCDPLADNCENLLQLIAGLEELAKVKSYKYVELRPVQGMAWGERSVWSPSEHFLLHRLDLSAGPEQVFRSFHRDCIQRKIRRAEKEGLEVTAGRDAETIGTFHNLVLQTRKRQGLVPQPLVWFRNLLECLKEAAVIRLARIRDRAVAGILTIGRGKAVVYKYGASDARFHKLGAMPYLFWRTIQEAIGEGKECLDLGRSDPDNHGLIAFKEHLGARGFPMSYWRFPQRAARSLWTNSWKSRVVYETCNRMPDSCLTGLGTLLYRHMG